MTDRHYSWCGVHIGEPCDCQHDLHVVASTGGPVRWRRGNGEWREVTPGEPPELTVTACPDGIIVVGDTASYALDDDGEAV